MRCGYCGSDYHSTANCPSTAQGQGNRNRMRCSYCGARDHNLSACMKTMGGRRTRENPDDYTLPSPADRLRAIALLAMLGVKR